MLRVGDRVRIGFIPGTFLVLDEPGQISVLLQREGSVTAQPSLESVNLLHTATEPCPACDGVERHSPTCPAAPTGRHVFWPTGSRPTCLVCDRHPHHRLHIKGDVVTLYEFALLLILALALGIPAAFCFGVRVGKYRLHQQYRRQLGGYVRVTSADE